MKNIIVCSANYNYIRDYAPSLLKSAELAGFEVLLDCIDFKPGSKEMDLVNNIKVWADARKFPLTVSFSEIKEQNKDVRRVLYSCGRIDAIINSMESDVTSGISNAYFSLDIDSVILRPFRFPVNGMRHSAFYFRDPYAHGASNEWEVRGMKLLGTFFVTTRMISYLKRVKLKIENLSSKKWFLDQVALYEALLPLDLGESHDFSQDKILGWDLDNPEECAVLTGKGQRKYMEQYKKYHDKFYNEFREDFKNAGCSI